MSSSSSDPSKAVERLVKKAFRAAVAADASTLPDSELKAIKQFARQADANVLLVFAEMFTYLSKNDSHVRLLSLELCSTLWARSAAFRRALLERLVPEFVQLVGGDPHNHPLPGAESWAERLPKRALELVESWDASHGQLDGYRSLNLARRHLKAAVQGGGGGAAAAEPSSSLEAQRAQRWRDKYDELRRTSEGAFAEIRGGADALEACLRILAPSFEESGSGTALFAQQRPSGRQPSSSSGGGGGGKAERANDNNGEEEEEEDDGDEEGDDGPQLSVGLPARAQLNSLTSPSSTRRPTASR